ncbi:MAG: aldose epimerase family protein, partial [Verrucomicrobiales bacterium]
DHPSEPDYPAHGFARTRAWEVVETGKDLHFSRLTLALKDSEETRAWFPHAFELEMRVILSKTLKLQFTVINLGETEFTYTGALHTYFAVSHIDRVSVEGLKGCTYIDSIDGGQRKTQEGPIRFAEEVDRIYVDTEDTCVIRDEEWKRDTRIVLTRTRLFHRSFMVKLRLAARGFLFTIAPLPLMKKTTILTLTLLASSLFAVRAQETPIISEFMASNLTAFEDEDGAAS